MKMYLVVSFLLFSLIVNGQARQWIQFEGNGSGAGKGKHIVFVSGDEEYRSEEALPMMAKILSQKHGFKCTVLFAIDPSTGLINPSHQTNIPGLENLAKADLLFMLIRFRELPDEQMKYIHNYIAAGKPIIALRTSTHAFNYTRNLKSPYAKYDFQSKVKGWEDGFGKVILGETWVAHHGKHGDEGTRGLMNGIELDAKNPLLNGVKDIWGPTDVYTVRKLPANANVLVYGQSTNGMTASSPVNLDKSIMPVAWTRTYAAENGTKGKAFTTTMGAAVDLVNEDLRRLLVNASYWAVGLEKSIPAKADVEIVGDYKPTMFGFDKFKKGLKVADFE